MDVFKNIGNYSYQYGSEPRNFSFRGKVAQVGASIGADTVAANFPDYVRKANTAYKEWKESTARKQEQQMRAELQERVNRERKRLADKEAVLRSIKIDGVSKG